MGLKVGELARRTGLTVRTLHHYDEIGLVPPSRRSQSKHRLYTTTDVERLQRVVSLRQLGLSLEQISDLLDEPGCTLERVLAGQIRQLRERIEAERDLCARLEGVMKLLQSTGRVSVDALLDLMESIMNAESHFTPEQLDYLRKQGEMLGEEHIRSVENEWPVLIGKVKAAMEAGLDPTSDEVVKLARRWRELVREFTGGDPGITRSLEAMYRSNLEKSTGHMGIDRAMSEYIAKALPSTSS